MKTKPSQQPGTTAHLPYTPHPATYDLACTRARILQKRGSGEPGSGAEPHRGRSVTSKHASSRPVRMQCKNGTVPAIVEAACRAGVPNARAYCLDMCPSWAGLATTWAHDSRKHCLPVHGMSELSEVAYKMSIWSSFDSHKIPVCCSME